MKFLVLFFIVAAATCVVEVNSQPRGIRDRPRNRSNERDETSEEHGHRRGYVHINDVDFANILNRRIPLDLPVDFVKQLIRGIVNMHHVHNALIHNESDDDSEEDSDDVSATREEDTRETATREETTREAVTREEGRGEVRRHGTLTGKGRVHVKHANDVLIHNESNQDSEEDSRNRSATIEVGRGVVRRGRTHRRPTVNIESVESGQIYNRNRN